jgi:hypothetical protein
MGIYDNYNSNNDGLVFLTKAEYAHMLSDAQDGARLKDWLKERSKSYLAIEHKELDIVCKLFGLVGEDE